MTQEEFEKIYDSYSKRIARFLFYYTKDKEQLEDWVQIVFLRLWKYRKSVNPGGDYLKTYLYKIARNVAIAELKKEKDRVFHYQSDMNEFPAAYERDEYPGPVSKTDLLMEKYQDVLERVPARAQEVYKLSREDGLTYQEIADTLQISPRTVEVHIRRVLRTLRQELKEFQY